MHIFALGPPEIRLGPHLVTFPTRKTLSLLIYLAVEGGLQPREHLSTLLWPESNPQRSYANLRNTLGHLQIALRQAPGLASAGPEAAYLQISHTSLGLNVDAKIQLDLQIVEQGYYLARADRSNRTLPSGSTSLAALQAAAACQRGDFLAGFSLGDAPAFDDWVAMQREVWRRRMGLIFDRLAEVQFARGEFAAATEAASHWIAVDALNEAAYRRKMQAHFAAGERGQALEAYSACRALLLTELGIEPEPDTTALAERIRTQTIPVHPHPRRSAPRPHLPDTSVAFLGNLFTGRASEYQKMVDSYARAAAGQPQLVILRGEAGIGKTRLAQKFLNWAGEQGTEVLQGGAFESASHLPFQPLVEALRLRVTGEDWPANLEDEVDIPQLIQLLPELRAGYPRPSSVGVAGRPAKVEISQAQIFELFAHLTLALAQSAPLVLFLDDVQWIDRATLDLLQYTLRRWKKNPSTGAVRCVLLVSLRSESLHPVVQPQPENGASGLAQWLVYMTHELTPVHITLEPLAERETVELAQSILVPPADDFAHWLYTETHGQPFYLIETLKDLLERRVLHPKRRAVGRWSFSVDSVHNLGQEVRVPSTVHTVIHSRLNRLSPNAFNLLAAAAVLEQQITFERLCAIANLTADPALPALDELLSGRLLLENVLPQGYTFINDMLRDVVYTEAGDARRRLFHQRALETLSATGETPAVLAHHAQAAGLPQDDFRYSLAAGSESLRVSALGEALVHLEHARQLVSDVEWVDMPELDELQELNRLFDQINQRLSAASQGQPL